MAHHEAKTKQRSVSNAKARISKFQAALNQDNDEDGLGLAPSAISDSLLQSVFQKTSSASIATGTATGKSNATSTSTSTSTTASSTSKKTELQATPTSWKNTLLACGSNAFGQLNFEIFDLMSSTLKPISLTNAATVANSTSSHSNMKRLGSFSSTGNGNLIQPTYCAVACGTNLTAVLVADSAMHPVNTDSPSTSTATNTCYMWGEGFSGGSSQLRVPTPMASSICIKHISCGQSHAGFVTDLGKAFTWGNGDNGMLGHGNKQTVNAPRAVTAIDSLFASYISCGAFHTAFIAAPQQELTYLRIPWQTPDADLSSQSSPVDRFREREINEHLMVCGDLYTCGLGKAGQLGLGSNSSLMTNNNATSTVATVYSPTLVVQLKNDGYRVGKVSCGFHHTLLVATPVHAVRTQTTSVFAFGWGDYGRLGLGDEEQRAYPCQISFPVPFHPIDVSAGEQHSIATGKGGCFSWGSNSMGQLGLGNPASLEFATTPTQIPIPEGMVVTAIAAGGRHTAAITRCGKLLTWGWGEEGQLGHGNEKSCYLPRPCRLPKVKGQLVRPVGLALGMSHTLVMVDNMQYIPPPPPPPPPPPAVVVIINPPEPELEPQQEMEPDLIEEVLPSEPELELEAEAEPREDEPPPASVTKAAVIAEEKEEFLEPIRSIRELLQMREDRQKEREMEKEAAKISTPRSPVQVSIAVEVIEENVEEEVVELTPLIIEEEPPIFVEQFVEESLSKLPVATCRPEDNKFHVYYRDGQSMDKCLVANSAKRAELRKLKKLQINST